MKIHSWKAIALSWFGLSTVWYNASLSDVFTPWLSFVCMALIFVSAILFTAEYDNPDESVKEEKKTR